MALEHLPRGSCAHAGCGLPAREMARETALCFWHDPDCDKRGANIRGELEDLARCRASLAEFQLAHADLRDINLNRRGSKKGYDLSNADLFHADLRGAHPFQADSTNASLMKAHLEDANLNHSVLRGANLLGVVFGNAKTENADWGAKIRRMTPLTRPAHAATIRPNCPPPRKPKRSIEICANRRKTPDTLTLRGCFLSGK